MAAPMPFEEPVMRATFPVKGFGDPQDMVYGFVECELWIGCGYSRSENGYRGLKDSKLWFNI